ncbi:MAG: cyclic nucleotide-binding domain-containing protein [Methylacidiphilales bacterium]|nr:cyclic nucleotide-binding domain-containing protein [Candidatus Methylacidiphilales bacterium]
MESSIDNRLALMKRVSLLSWLEAGQVATLAGRAEIRHYAEGDVIFEPGSPGDGLHIIADGEVTFVSGPPDELEHQSASTLEAGATFGELSLVDKQPRKSRARAALPTTVYFLPLAILEDLSRSHPEQYATLITNLAREMARKIRRLNQVKLASQEAPAQT